MWEIGEGNFSFEDQMKRMCEDHERVPKICWKDVEMED